MHVCVCDSVYDCVCACVCVGKGRGIGEGMHVCARARRLLLTLSPQLANLCTHAFSITLMVCFLVVGSSSESAASRWSS